MAPVCLPPGFRFHPTDEELVAYYLDRKITGRKIELEIIPEIDLYKCEPWDLPEKSFLPGKDMEWYFFSPRDRKYPNGSRTNRATRLGYWKATGKDRSVHSEKKAVGMKKTLVYYKGRAPHGIRTNWVMHEYRLVQSLSGSTPSLKDSYSLCRVFKKPIHNSRGKEEIVNVGITENNDQYIDEDLQEEDPSRTDAFGAGSSENDQNNAKMLGQDHGFPTFPSAASSELSNQEQEATPAGSALSTDHDLQAPLFTTDEANSSANFYPFGFDYSSSSLIQDIQMGNSCFSFPQFPIDDFTQISVAEGTLMPGKSTTYNGDAMEITGCDKFKEYMNGTVMFEDIFDLCSTQPHSSVTLPLEH